MSEKFISRFESFPEFLSSRDLVELGLWPSDDAVYFARLRGLSPDFIKVGRKVLYPKSSVVEFIQNHLKSGKPLGRDKVLADSNQNNQGK